MEGDQRNREWEARQKKRKAEKKAAIEARPDPEEADRLALEKGELVQASDGKWYDGQTDEEREEQDRARKDRWARENDAREIAWVVDALSALESAPETLIPEFSDEDLETLTKGLGPAIELLEKLRPALQRQAKEEND